MLHEVTIPRPGESVSEVSISAWLKKDGDFVKKNQELFEIESDKATLSVSAEVEGQLKILISQGETIRVGAVACTIDTAITAGAAPASINGAPAEKQAETPKPQAPVSAPSYASGVPSPSAQKMMAEQNLKPEDIEGSGRGGRITKSDVVEQSKSAPAPQISTPAPAPKPAPMIAGSRAERREKMSTLRQKISERLVYAKNQTAMLTTFNEIDMSNAMAIRTKYKDKFKETHQVGLGFMSFFSRAAVEALKQFPAVNAYIEGTDIIYHDFVDLGIAVQAPKGLVVPVVRNAESMTMDQFEAEIERLAARARNNQLTIDEMTGGTFTISNGGVFGNLMSTPILNPPQSAILGMHNIVKRPIAIDDQVVIRPMMYVAVSYDHRIIDGRESVGFLKRVKELVEDPIRLLLQV